MKADDRSHIGLQSAVMRWKYRYPVTYLDVTGDAMPSRQLTRVDRRAFGKEYTGQHDVRIGRDGVAVVARRGRSMVGYALAIPSLGGSGPTNQPWVMDTVAVVPAQQSAGLGTSLLCRLAALLDERGVRVVLATPLGGSDEERRRAWLERLGFRQGERGLEASTRDLRAR